MKGNNLVYQLLFDCLSAIACYSQRPILLIRHSTEWSPIRSTTKPLLLLNAHHQQEGQECRAQDTLTAPKCQMPQRVAHAWTIDPLFATAKPHSSTAVLRSSLLPPFFSHRQGGEKFGGFVVIFQVINITKSAILATLPSSLTCR